MEEALNIQRIFEREQPRLRNFIRRRVADARDAEDLVQDVFIALMEADRLTKPIEQAGAWLFEVARNRITDLFRKKRPEAFTAENDRFLLEDLLPSPREGPEAAYARTVLLDELDAALDELPEAQRDVFVAHEIEGLSFKEISAETGVSVNTLLSRKHYAVQHLRKRLQAIYEEFKRGE
jgi:RNA polymerase sigma factor (sigma-70 family)